MKQLFGTLFIALLAAVSSNGYAESDVENLSPELRALLKKEMLAIQEGMQNIVPAFAAGDLAQVADIAGKISGSFILQQNITDAQKHELHTRLSEEFVHKDQQFHEYAGMLEHVSQENHTELVGFYYSRLLESCVDCHSEHATHRFPNFTKESPGKEHHH